MSPRITFEKELSLLRENVTDMAKRVEKNYEDLFATLENQSEEDIFRIIKTDKEINKKQREIESECLFLITKQQPIVGDLRIVTASLKVVTDIERVGDHVADMAELLLRMGMKNLEQYSAYLIPMVQAAKEMVHASVSAFLQRDVKAAQKVIKSDDVVDELFGKIRDELIELLKKDARDADECVDTLMFAKYLEKIGDHAVNISEWSIFEETGNISDVRIL